MYTLFLFVCLFVCSTPGAGFYNKDDIPDFMVKYNRGSGFPVYFYSNVSNELSRCGGIILTPG